MHGFGTERRSRDGLDWTDEELVASLISGEPRAWSRLVDKYIGLVAHAARQTLRARLRGATEDDVDEVVEEVYTHLIADDYRALRNFRAPFNMKSWLAISAARKALDLCKRRRPQVSLDAASDPEGGGPFREGPARKDETAPREDAEAVRKAVSEAPLNAKERVIVAMYFYDEASYAEIASAVGISENSIGPTLRRALDKIEEVLKQER